jgi:hypothetical protein
MSAKIYRINLDVYKSNSAQVAKLPKQQQIILACMAKHCVETGMKGSDVIDLAKKEFGLETRQKSTVLYAWYARSNEAFGVFHSVPTLAPIPIETKPEVTKSKTK